MGHRTRWADCRPTVAMVARLARRRRHGLTGPPARRRTGRLDCGGPLSAGAGRATSARRTRRSLGSRSVCAMLALSAWRQAATGADSTCWSIVAGCMLGTALAIEPLGIGFGLAIAVITAWRSVHQQAGRTQAAGSLAILTVIACGLSACWYFRSSAGPAQLPRPGFAARSPGVVGRCC